MLLSTKPDQSRSRVSSRAPSIRRRQPRQTASLSHLGCLDSQVPLSIIRRPPGRSAAMPKITFQDEKHTISTTTSTSFGFLKDVTGVSSPASVYQVSLTEELVGGGGTNLKDDASNYGSTPDHVFSDPAIAAYWADVYERAGYENRHRFDPSFEWGASEERKLVRKMDLRIVFWAWIMFCSLDLHRKNINRAISDDMLPELGGYVLCGSALPCVDLGDDILTWHPARNEHKRLQLWSNHLPCCLPAR